MATLKLINYMILNSQGVDTVGKQGNILDASTDLYNPATSTVLIAGDKHDVRKTLATATVVTAYDDSASAVTGFDYGFFWADVDMYVQLVTASVQVIHKVLAKTPYVIPGYGTCLPAANTTIMSGGTEPTTVEIKKINIGNYSGSTGNFILLLVD